MDELYRDVILEHYRSPRNRGRLAEPSVATRGYNPLCGDDVEISLAVENDVIVDARFQGRGCSISQASASMLTEAVRGKTLAETRRLAEAFKAAMRGEDPGETDLSDVEALQGVRKYPVRVKCALLPWTTLLEGVDQYTRSHGGEG